MKKVLLIIGFIGFYLLGHSQNPLTFRGNSSGLFSLGMRSTVSLFNNHNWKSVGLGAGGHFRIQYLDQVGSEWFADFASSNLENVARREDAHIGTSVMFYFLPGNVDCSKLFKPFIEAGYCFDWTRVVENKNPTNSKLNFSSALQGGMGTHINLTQRFDISVKAQYMMHLGNDLDMHIENGEVHIEKNQKASVEGHLFLVMSVNYKIADLWGKRAK